MPNTIPVNVFNANLYDVNMMVNRGIQVTAVAVNMTTWAPGTIATNAPTWDNGGGGKNTFGPGDNPVQVQLGSGSFTNVVVTLPDTNPSSVQLYFFFPAKSAKIGTVSWCALYGASLVAMGTSQLDAKAIPGG